MGSSCSPLVSVQTGVARKENMPSRLIALKLVVVIF